ncbi:unannotated protein [freshwater metagenome]|uniref:Unannotated protein n=1 Tax=freshwater metagenome TaxID=449393 RepID=A0A6J7DCQ7_9ZZZZ
MKGGATVVVQRCATGGAGRSATFRGSMPASPSLGGRMEMRFTLSQRAARATIWNEVPGVDAMGVWDRSSAGIGAFIVRKRVAGLEPGFSYRVVVDFRWHAADGSVQRKARKFSRACTQPNRLPDLLLEDPAISLGTTPDLLVYRVFVRNRGRAVAPPSEATLTVNGIEYPPVKVGAVGTRGRGALVIFRAPRCKAGSIVRFTADAAGEVTEGDETNNVLRRRCGATPAPS